MKNHALKMVALVVVTLLPFAYGHSQELEGAPQSADPLAKFALLVGAQWHLGDSYQEFEWGVGRRSLRARGYFIVNGQPRLASEGVWYWHPGEQVIKGVFTATGMPVDLFDYTTRFEGSSMVNDLRAYSAEGAETLYREVWEFTDDEHYEWKLMRKTSEGFVDEMGGTYTKRAMNP